MSSALLIIGEGLIAVLFGILMAMIFYKLRRCHLMQYSILAKLDKKVETDAIDNLYSQIEAMQNLYRDLKLERSLPPMRNFASSPDFLVLIARHVFNKQPNLIVECSSGVSTVVLARCIALQGKGHVYSLEHDPEFAEITRGHLKRLELSDYATVVDAKLQEYTISDKIYKWYDFEKLPNKTIDLLVIDGPPEKTCKYARYPAGPLLFERMSVGSYLILHDADRDDEKHIVKSWVDEYSVDYEDINAKVEKGCVFLVKNG